MRADLAPLIATAMYLFAGFGVLAAAGTIRAGAWGVLAATGLAYMAGMAGVLLVGIALMAAGLSLGLGGIAAIAVAIGVGGLAAARWRAPRSRAAQRSGPGGTAQLRRALAAWGPEQWFAAVIVAVIVVYLVAGYAAASRETIFGWDSFSIWSRKALLLLHAGKPDAAFFSSDYYTFMNPDYPILLPFAESIFFRISGTTDFQVLHGQFWILFAAFLWAAGYVASRVARPLLWAPLIALLAVTPGLEVGVRTMYADVPMSLFLGIGVLLVGIWITDRRPGDLALGTLMLAAAASTKNEGLAAAAGVLVVALLVTVIARDGGSVRSAAAAPLVALAALGAAVAPWRLWVGAHDVPTVTIPVSKGFDPGFVIGHADRIHPTVAAIGSEVADPGKWYYLLPLALAMAIAALRTPGERRLVAFYAGAGLLVFAAIVIWGYVINTIPIDELIDVTASRTVDAIMLVAVAALLHLSGRALPPSSAADGRLPHLHGNHTGAQHGALHRRDTRQRRRPAN